MTANLSQLLQTQAQQTPAAIALIDAHGQPYTFAALQTAAHRCAAYLKHHCQLQPGEGVLLLQPLSAELYISLAALWQLGAVAVILNPLLGQQHIAQCAQQINLRVWVGPGWLFATQLRSRTLRQIPHKLSTGYVRFPGTVSWRWVQRMQPEAGMVNLSPDTLALLSFTSGTTGQPKAIGRSHQLLYSQYRALAPVLKWQPGAAELTTLPLFGLANLVAGGTTVIPPVNVRRPARVSGAKLRHTIEQHQISRLVAAPGIAGQLIEGSQGRTLTSLRQIFLGGAPVSWKLRDRLQQLAPNAAIHVVYGATEAEPIAHLAPRDVAEGDRTRTQQGYGLLVGHPVAAIALRIVHLEAQTIQEQAPGQPGEVIVSGSHVLPSSQQLIYQNQQWHRTGDLGYLDKQGRLWLLGRSQAMIHDDRGILYPLAVEAMVNELPGVARSALVQWQGQRLLCVEPTSNANLKRLNCELRWRAERDLPKATTNCQLDRLLFVRRLPTDSRHNAKVNRPRLHQQLRRWLR